MNRLPMNVQERVDLICRGTAEVIGKEELPALLESGQPVRHYIGFEISGKIHLGTGLACMAKVKDFQDAGIQCTIFLADWHTWINDKLGGDRDTIRKVATGYFQEGLKASLKCLGGDPSMVRFVLGSDLYHHNDEFWATVVDVSKHTTLARMQRSITILGRKEGESVDFAKLLYPAMQVADLFTLGAHLSHAGLDQRKAHVIARECALQMKHRPLTGADGRPVKPVAVHHPLLLGLGKPPLWPVPAEKKQDLWSALKMSKSVASSAIYIHDSPEEISRKVTGAFCPPNETEFNPILDWVRQILFRTGTGTLKIDRPDRHGGPIEYLRYGDLENDYRSGALHPVDLKNAVSSRLAEILAPAREHFAQPGPAQMLHTLDGLAAPPGKK